MQELIAILDFGSQYTQLIARRIRELNVYTEILPPSITKEELKKKNPKGVILSGGPASTGDGAVPFDPSIFQLELPILGVCYGMQLMNVCSRGTVKSQKLGEYGKQKVSLNAKSALFKGLEAEQTVWMSHGDSVESLAPGFLSVAKSCDGIIAAIAHEERPLFGLQFHPEVTHTEQGRAMIDNFIACCRCRKGWTLENRIDEIKQEIREQVGEGHVISLISGGVDSTVSTFLCYEALGKERVTAIHIDNGLMRAGESRQVLETFREHGFDSIDFIDASESFLSALKGVEEPEEKRKIIGQLFIEILQKEIEKIDAAHGKSYLCQGTLYTDLIESGKGCGSHAATIKSHHNVNAPIIEEKRAKGLVVEPNRHFFKDEVREAGAALGISRTLLSRHPFPGPGLAIRIIGEITEERLEALRAADSLYLEEIRRAGLYDEIWQAFAILLPIRSVGVMGDKRTVGNVAALRAVTSVDGMTADFYEFPQGLLSRISSRIINEVPSINRVAYDITSKPPGTIEWE